MKKITAYLLSALLAASLMAGCAEKPAESAAPAEESSSSSAAVESSSEASAGASSESAPADAATPVVDAIKEKGKIVMLTNATFPPFEYMDGSEAAGVDIDVANEIAKDLGVELEVVDMNFDLLIDSLKADKGDFVAAGMTILPERLEQVDFSIEYVKSAQHLIVPKGSDTNATNLDGKVIAVQENTTGDFFATDEVQAKEVLRFKNAVEAGSALAAGKCDAVIIDKLPAESIATNNADKLEVLPDPLTEESYAFAVKKGNADLLAAINATLQRLVDEGKVDEFVIKHMAEA